MIHFSLTGSDIYFYVCTFLKYYKYHVISFVVNKKPQNWKKKILSLLVTSKLEFTWKYLLSKFYIRCFCLGSFKGVTVAHLENIFFSLLDSSVLTLQTPPSSYSTSQHYLFLVFLSCFAIEIIPWQIVQTTSYLLYIYFGGGKKKKLFLQYIFWS